MKKTYVALVCCLFLSILTCRAQDCSKKIFDTLSKLEKAGIEFPQTNLYALESFVGCNFPDFKAKTISGDSISLNKLKGKIVVVNFWFDGCPPCIAEMRS